MATISFKVSDKEAQDLQAKADREGRSKTAIILSGLRGEEMGATMHDDMDRMRRENQELRRQLAASRNGRRPTTDKRVTVRLSLEEYDAVSEVAHKMRTSRSAVIRGIITKPMKKGRLPALEGPDVA